MRVTGWGRMEEDGVVSSELQEVVLETFESSKCAAHSSLNINDLTSNMFCAGDLFDGGKSTLRRKESFQY